MIPPGSRIRDRTATAALAILLSGQACTSEKPLEQPVVFSHRVHVENKITCTFCHPGAEKIRQAVIPSVTLCMSCHSVIKAESPAVEEIKAYFDRSEEIPWRRIYQMPESADVHFNHRRHAAAQIECSVCHGEVASQDRLKIEVDHTMGFCVRCHVAHQEKFRDPRLAADCATCHG